jgi:hypothetical protein
MSGVVAMSLGGADRRLAAVCLARPSSGRRRSLSRNRVVRAAVGGALLLALAGCVSLDMDLSVSKGDTMSGAIVVAFDRKALTPFASSDDLLKQVERQNPLGRKPAHGTIEIQDYETDKLVGKKYVYADVPLSDFNAVSGLSIRHEGRRYRLDGELDLSGGGDPRVDIGALTKTAAATVRIAFPGKVLSSNGEVTGKSVTWRPPFGEKATLTAEADDGRPVAAPPSRRSEGVSPWLLAGVAGAIALVALALLTWAFLARRRRLAALGAGSVVEPAELVGPSLPKNPTLPLPVLETPDSLLRDPRWGESAPSDPWQSGQAGASGQDPRG